MDLWALRVFLAACLLTGTDRWVPDQKKPQQVCVCDCVCESGHCRSDFQKCKDQVSLLQNLVHFRIIDVENIITQCLISNSSAVSHENGAVGGCNDQTHKWTDSQMHNLNEQFKLVWSCAKFNTSLKK